MVVIINSIQEINFKGSVNEIVEFHPKFTKIYGTNGSGKSRVFEAYTWGMTGKDTLDRKDYDIKNNKRPEMNRQDHVVIIDQDVDKNNMVIKRMYREKWVKKSRTPAAKMDGHETDFFKNDVPYTATQFKELINGIAKENTIKLVTNPLFFNNLPWKDQREVLIGFAGPISDEEITEHAAKDARIDMDILNKILHANSDMNEQKAGLNAKKKKLVEELEGIPHRIDQENQGRPTESDEDFAGYESAIQILKDRDDAIVAQMTELQNEGSKKMKEFYDEQNKVLDLRAQAQQLVNNRRREYKAIFDDKENAKKIVASKMTLIKQSIASDEKLLSYEKQKLAKAKADFEKAKEEFASIKNSTFVFDRSKYEGPKTCPTCAQKLPDGDRDLSAIENNEKIQFNQNKQSLETVKKKQATDLRASFLPLEQTIVDYENSIQEKQSQIPEIEAELAQVESGVMPSDHEILAEMQENEDYKALISKADNLESILPEEPKPVQSLELKTERIQISNERDRLIKLLAGRDTNKRINQTIAVIEEREAELSQMIADVEQQIFAIEGYTSSKMALVEQRVNELFDEVSFKLFSTLVNGEIIPDCVMWHEGNPWTSLSTAQKITAGLLCIRTFCKQFQLWMPIWIDNSESIVKIPEMDSQVICMYVSEKDKKIRTVHG